MFKRRFGCRERIIFWAKTESESLEMQMNKNKKRKKFLNIFRRKPVFFVLFEIFLKIFSKFRLTF